ncbi:hypothetical protein H0O00_01205 [Candidatus Micrarchaeota archaeon]|nr:hypothetical protein [Candidatus Micrarchaeota archaeon]
MTVELGDGHLCVLSDKTRTRSTGKGFGKYATLIDRNVPKPNETEVRMRVEVGRSNMWQVAATINQRLDDMGYECHGPLLSGDDGLLTRLNIKRYETFTLTYDIVHLMSRKKYGTVKAAYAISEHQSESHLPAHFRSGNDFDLSGLEISTRYPHIADTLRGPYKIDYCPEIVGSK